MMVLLVGYVIVINIVGFTLMKVDKDKARKGKYRIQEKTLWNTAILGGAIGSSIGMNLFRHKTKHRNFKWGMPVLAYVEGVIWLYLLWKLS
ncbi:DUF1294 domain-containing protein [Falsibacillus albus]|uniref:DUF1294 domain-containing protein n=1 Tax=Falsibacillus albus TaxID=2478915 RepID=A0A3L7K4I8_9BACI|nr:DUF1294 domain-containing protein [Falsibacillus albus]RLQ97986.1 DUF1294 domain-containing protein [Falsibacillus albus]